MLQTSNTRALEAEGLAWRDIPVDDETLGYVMRYGGRCRECADHAGICPTSGLPCDIDEAKAAIRHVLRVINFGKSHGFPATPTAEPIVKAGETLQARVQPWMMACFGPEISADRVERGDRLLEEVFELLQSGGYDPARVLALRDYVWGREVGEPFQEAGGVQITLAAYCLAHDLDMHEAGEAELARIWTKVDKIRAKQAAKPVGSALPVVAAPSLPVGDDLDGLVERLKEHAGSAVNHWEDWANRAESLMREAATCIAALRAENERLLAERLCDPGQTMEILRHDLQRADARAEASEAKLEQARTDAERWRALMSSQRMHFMGCAGIDLVNKPGTTDRKTANLIPVMKPGEYQHFGMEFWSEHGAFGNPEFPDDFERSLLVAYVDHLRAARSLSEESSNG